MTGVYPFKMGLQRSFGKQAPDGVPLNFKFMSEYMQDEGYNTHALGKEGFLQFSYLS